MGKFIAFSCLILSAAMVVFTIYVYISERKMVKKSLKTNVTFEFVPGGKVPYNIVTSPRDVSQVKKAQQGIERGVVV